MPLTALLSLTSANPNFDPRILLPRPPSPSPPFSSPHLLTRQLPTQQPAKKDTTHRCLLPAARYPLPARGAHSHPFDRPRLRIFSHTWTSTQAAALWSTAGADALLLHICTTSATSISTKHPAAHPSPPASKPASRQASKRPHGDPVELARLFLGAFARLFVVEGRTIHRSALLSPPTRRLADWLSSWASDWID